jgi:hypothetical protein
MRKYTSRGKTSRKVLKNPVDVIPIGPIIFVSHAGVERAQAINWYPFALCDSFLSWFLFSFPPRLPPMFFFQSQPADNLF